jgi:hypothetical protein
MSDSDEDPEITSRVKKAGFNVTKCSNCYFNFHFNKSLLCRKCISSIHFFSLSKKKVTLLTLKSRKKKLILMEFKKLLFSLNDCY